MIANALQRMPLLRLAAGAYCLIFGLGGCFEDDGNGTRWDVDLRVPYRAQPNDTRLCAPASIYMWTKYDFGSSQSPEQICTGTPGLNCTQSGTTPQSIPAGVNFHTATNDAIYQVAQAGGWDTFWSGQIASIVNNAPVIQLVDGGHHVVLVFGGNYITFEIDGEHYYQWQEVLYHDPLDDDRRRADQAGFYTLTRSITRQIVSAQWKNHGANYADLYGDEALVLGDWRRNDEILNQQQ